MVNLVKKETITAGPPARCARHDITLSVHIRTNVMTLGKYPNHHIWPSFRSGWGHDTSDSGCLRRKGCNTIWRDDIVRFSGNVLWKRVPKQEFILNSRGGWGGGWGTQRHIFKISKRMDFHNYVNKEITFVISNDIMMYARGKTYTIKHWLKGAPEIWAGLHDQC